MKKWIIAALSAATTLGATAENTNTVNGNRIVVTATRSASDVQTVPANPTVITSQDIERGHYTSVPEALQKKAGVFFRNFADNPSMASIDLRGFGGDNPHGKVLVLLNGRKLNRPDMATINWAQIPMQAVERIEVIRGPNSVLYGDHAVGGTINIITKEGFDKPETSIQASIGSYETYNQNLVTSGNLNGLNYVASVGHQSGDGYRDRSAYDTSSGSLRLSGNINDRLSAYAELSTVKEQHQLPGDLTIAQVQQNRKQSVNPADSASEKYYSFNAGIEALLTDEMIFNLDAGASTKDLQADMASFWIPYYFDYKINSCTLSPKLTLLHPFGEMENELILGLDLTRETLKTKKYADRARLLLSTDTEVTKEVIGGYVVDTLSLTDQLLLSGGVRLEQNRVNVNHKGMFVTPYDELDTHTKEAWQAALTWLPTDTLKVFAGIDRTYRYPFVDEQAIYSGWGDAFNKDLEPETGINYEIGIEYMPVTNLVLQATLFRTDMEDEIAWGITNNINLDETTHYGVELSVAYLHEIFALNAYYTWLQSEFSAGANKGNDIPWVPQNKLDVSLALFLTDALTFSTHMSYVGSMYPLGDNDNNTTEKQSGYTIFDLLIEYVVPVRNCEVTVFAGIDNVFETEYNFLATDYGWGTIGHYPAPEQTYKAGLGITF